MALTIRGKKWGFDRNSIWINYSIYTIISAGGNNDQVNGLRHRAWRHRPYRGRGNSGYLGAYRRGRARGRRQRADRARSLPFHRPFERRNLAGKRPVGAGPPSRRGPGLRKCWRPQRGSNPCCPTLKEWSPRPLDDGDAARLAKIRSDGRL